MFRDDAVYSTAVVNLSHGLLWHWSYSRLDRHAIIIIVFVWSNLPIFLMNVVSKLKIEEKTHFGVLENVRCSKVYVVKCTFYWGLIYKDKEGNKRELAKMHLIARKTQYGGTLYQGSTVFGIVLSKKSLINLNFYHEVEIMHC